MVDWPNCGYISKVVLVSRPDMPLREIHANNGQISGEPCAAEGPEYL